MKRMLPLIGVFIITAGLGYHLILGALPSFVFRKADQVTADRGVALHGFTLAPRITPESQTVVRSSPDMAYSICRFDLSGGPVLIEAEPWHDYASIAVYAGNTDNILTERLGPERTTPVTLRLVRARNDRIGVSEGTVPVPTDKGMVLIRRLAPTEELYAKAADAATGDICRPVG